VPPTVRAVVQARMSSRRFPGKVLAPFRGEPLIAHVLAALRRALPAVPVVVATSGEPADDPLALYVASTGTKVFRGPLDDVLARFRLCAAEYPSDWILRVSADSPLLDAGMLKQVVAHAASAEHDLVTTIHPRTFPRGHNAELIRATALAAIDGEALSEADREHVTPFFYRHPERFRILNVESGDPDLAGLSFAVDTLEDLRRLEGLAEAEPAAPPPLSAASRR
jgi:spore coat polysaccharide biosynthesis protein SpsF